MEIRLIFQSEPLEEQMASTLEQPDVDQDNGIVSEDAKRIANQHRTERERQIQELNLQRENILSQKTSHPARREALKAALSQIEASLAKLS